MPTVKRQSEIVLIAIDPGTKRSGWVRYDFACHYKNLAPERIESGIVENGVFTDGTGGRYRFFDPFDHLAIEMTASMGMAVGASVFETTYWIGRFCQASVLPFTRINRQEVKLHLCGTPRARDSNIRQRLIDLWGGKEKAIGFKATKKRPHGVEGPLHDMKKDCWQALALAVTWWEQHREDC